MEENLKNKTLSSLVWQFGQKIFGQLFSFIVTVILARILLPEDYGLVALSSMFLTLVGVFADTGLGAALIQKKEPDELDYNTVFYANFLISFFVYGVVFFSAPLFSDWYGKPELKLIIRIIALSLPIGALSGVQTSFVKKQMMFKKLFITSLTGTFVGSIVGLAMAYSGLGVWALVGQNITSTIVNSIVLFYVVSWHPRFIFSYQRFRTLFSFGWRMTIVNVINTFSYQLKGYAIGLKYSAADLAFYNRGEGLPGILMNNINGSISTVLFPALSLLQDDTEALKRAISRSIRISCFFLMPILFCLAAMSERIILLLYTDKWASAIPFMQVICFTSCSDVIGSANYQALLATGKVKTLMRLEYIKRPLMIGLVLTSMLISPFAIVVSMFAYSVIATFVNAYPNKKYINYSLVEQIKDIFRSFISAFLSAVTVYLVGQTEINSYLCVLLQLIVGVILYVFLSYFINRDDFFYILNNLKKKMHNNK